MGKRRYTELHQGKLKKIHREQYEALISIKWKMVHTEPPDSQIFFHPVIL